jgi:hypothetical protein
MGAMWLINKALLNLIERNYTASKDLTGFLTKRLANP